MNDVERLLGRGNRAAVALAGLLVADGERFVPSFAGWFGSLSIAARDDMAEPAGEAASYARSDFRRLRLWRRSLRMYGGTALLAQLSLSGLSTRDRQRLRSYPRRAELGVCAHEREAGVFR